MKTKNKRPIKKNPRKSEYLSLEEIVQERKKRENYLKKRQENGDRLLKQVINQKSMKIDKSVKWFEETCEDVIAAAKRSDQKFQWTRDWRRTGVFSIALSE